MTQTLLHYSMLWSDYDLIDQVNEDQDDQEANVSLMKARSRIEKEQ